MIGVHEREPRDTDVGKETTPDAGILRVPCERDRQYGSPRTSKGVL